MKMQLLFTTMLLMMGVFSFGQLKIDATGTNDMRLRTNNTDRVNILTNGNVGIGTAIPNAKLDVLGDFSFSKKCSLTTTGIQNALDRQGASRVFIDAGGTVTLNGIAGGVDGLMIFLYTGSLTTLIINNLDVSALSANRIATHTGANVTITARGGASLIYDGTTLNWRIYGFADENASWNAKGNAGTVPGTDFIGTSDSQALVIKTNNLERMSISATGDVGVGISNAGGYKLNINGSQFINSNLRINSLVGTGVRSVQVDATGLLMAGTTTTTNTYSPFISVSSASARKIGIVTDSDFQYMLPACLASFVSGIKYGDGQIVMPVEFPDGATLTSMHLSAIDNSNGHILEAKLMKVPKIGTASVQTSIGSVSTSGLAMSASVQEATFLFSVLTTIDNGNNFYYILVDITSSSSSWPGGAILALRGVRFKYDITY